MKKIIKALDVFFNNKTVKYLVVYSIAIFVFYIIADSINSLIKRQLTVNEYSLKQIPDVFFFLFLIISITYVVYKLILKCYQLSYLIIHVIFSLNIIYLITRLTNYPKGWEYISFGNTKLLYIDFIGCILLISAIIVFILYVLKSIPKQKTNNDRTPFVSDDPIFSKNDDKLNYQKRAIDILAYLDKSNFANSFTIGIVGPWGNGKSSLIGLIEEELIEKPLNSTIHLKFLPYLNHSETDIISEFFKQLSVEINKYSGSLSNQFLNYSDKLLKLYKNKSVTDFLKPNSSLFSESSSYDTYKKINKTLKELNKKFIVFIDDLDRLSNKEVLQVLKLVRNTANFKNFIFLIALDKDYVLESLIVKNDIADHTFVDKFFQLEVYLPEIEKSQLKTDFIELLRKTDLHNQLIFISDVETSIYRKDNLFDDYISNYRGVKRLINQLVFDYSSLPDELNTNDFLNFTYLKMTFPFAVKLLNRNWSKIIPFNPETNLCELIIIEEDSNISSTINLIRKTRKFFADSELNIEYDEYEISKGISDQEKITENSLSRQQNILLAKTLIILFGKENIAESHTSIKFENNLRKLLQQKTNENDLNEIKFRSMFNLDHDFENLNQLLKAGHCNNILNRMAYFNTKDKEEALKTIIILLYIFNDAENYGTYIHSVWNILSDFIIRQLNLRQNNVEIWNEKEKTQIWDYINQEFIDKDFNVERKIEYLALISQHRIKLNFSDWGTTENNLKELSLVLYKNLVASKQNVLWDINDYSFYHAYHNVRKLNNADIVNPITIEFWENNDITILCAQMTQNDVWTPKMFKTSDFANQLFGSKYKYQIFIHNNLPVPITQELKEYIEFLDLESYAEFSNYIRFEFTQFDFIKQKLQKAIETSSFKNDEFEKVVEVVIKSKEKYLGEITRTNLSNTSISGFISMHWHEIDGISYTFIRLETATYHKAIQELLEHYKDLLSFKNVESIISPNKKILTIEGAKESIEIISVQPNSYDSYNK